MVTILRTLLVDVIVATGKRMLEAIEDEMLKRKRKPPRRGTS